MVLGLAVPLVDQRLDGFDDPLLTRRRRIELPAHLNEATADVFPEIAEGLPEIDEIGAKRSEARGGRLAEIADLGSYLGYVAVSLTHGDEFTAMTSASMAARLRPVDKEHGSRSASGRCRRRWCRVVTGPHNAR